MKTEQELKDALEDIFFDALTDTSNPPYYTDKVDPENDGYWQCKVYELCADELIKRGYGDISEYKAEIEQLKEVIKNYKEVLCETTQRKDDAIKLNDKLVEEYESKIKQAKIDVLAELNAKYGIYLCYSWHRDTKSLSEIIDKFIKEVQNAEDKS